MDELTDSHLIAQWRRGDQEAFAVLVSRHAGVVHAACRRQAAPGDDEDCVQAVFLVLARKPEAAGRAVAVSAWLLRVAWFICQQSRRSSRRRRQVEREATTLTADRAPVSTEAAEHLDSCLATLPEQQRVAVTLHYLAGRTAQEVAATLGTSRANAYQLLSRGLRGLRAQLARRGVVVADSGLLAMLAAESHAASSSPPSTMVPILATQPSATAASLATGAITAMSIATITPWLAAALLVLAAGALALSAEPSPPAVISPREQPAVAGPALIIPPSWAAAAGRDQYGSWADLRLAGVMQRLRWIPAGHFIMGSPLTEDGHIAEEVQHQVTFSAGFWMADTTCTQALWRAVIGTTPSEFTRSPQDPVERVSWDDCQTFLTKLNGMVPGAHFTLPTEAQWEYTCRAGTTTPYSFGATITQQQVNFGHETYGELIRPNSTSPPPEVPSPVAVTSLPPNAWGLYQMHGNVWQWCSDWYGNYSGQAERDPTGPPSGGERVFRGSQYGDDLRACRCAYRRKYPPNLSMNCLGFRFISQAPALTDPPPTGKGF